jgi:SRSO17 transposase
MARAGVPEPFRRSRSKPEIALEEIDWPTAAAGRFGAVLADAGYGLSAPFRQGLSVAAETMLSKAKWKKVSWRRGVKGPLSARFAALRIRIADGPPQRILNKGKQHMSGEAAWLIGEWHSSGDLIFRPTPILEPIHELVESHESFVIPLHWLIRRGAQFGNLNIVWPANVAAFVIRVI